MKPKGNSFDKKQFGKKLKELRSEIGITQDEFALRIKRTRVAYLLIEQGKTSQSVDLIVDIIRTLHAAKKWVTIDYLVGITHNKNDGENAKELRTRVEKLEAELQTCKEISGLQKQLLGKK